MQKLKRVWLDEETHHILKIISAFLGVSIKKALEIIIKEYSNKLKQNETE